VEFGERLKVECSRAVTLSLRNQTTQDPLVVTVDPSVDGSAIAPADGSPRTVRIGLGEEERVTVELGCTPGTAASTATARFDVTATGEGDSTTSIDIERTLPVRCSCPEPDRPNGTTADPS